ncbi:MAG TPA: hypothetical protein VKQ06_09310, partial [Gammaproteobacteria bacterium]|nr:hypothetical protein [Gammaproteobacteria bacterium]
MNSERAAAIALAAIALAAALALGACSSGSGGSDVGSHVDVLPTARPQVLNGGTANIFREGAEVLLSGKASEDRGGPLIDWA